MPRFYFDTYDGDLHVCDEDGLDLPNVEAVRVAALDALPAMARDVFPKSYSRLNMATAVRDETGRLVFTATLSLVARWVE